MKNKFFHFITLSTAALAFAGCVDTEIEGITASQLDSIANLAYLKDYGALKDYVNRSENPDFKLGAGVAASSFINSGIEYRVAAANFDEVTAGNAMKYASCVADDGSMDFGTVMEFVNKAKEDGITIYGHTLAWHSQQNNKYLNSLLIDKELPPAVAEGSCLHIKTGEAKDNPWDWQLLYDLTTPLKAGKTYKLTMEIKASDAVSYPLWIETPGAGNTHYGLGNISAGINWKDFEMNITPNSDCTRLLFSFGQFGGDMYMDNVSLKEAGTDNELIEGGDFETPMSAQWSKPGWHGYSFAIEDKPGDASATVDQEIRTRTYTDGPFPFFAMGCEPPVINGAIHFVPTGAWSQFFILPGGENTLAEGNYCLYLDLTADKDATGVQLTMQNGWGGDAQSISVSVPVAAGRHNVRLDMPGVAGGNYDVILKPQTADATLDLHSVRVCKVVNMNSIPLTPEEKKDTLIWAMDKWITGMMNACEGYVTTWDVVNEALAGTDKDGDGYYDLQSATRGTVSEDDAANNFYWQDYLGDLDYVRTVVRLARERFAESGGEPSKLKLFINDYNLESDWDNNAKVKSLVRWIEQWEADGTTKIDGIGSQMHVSCFANEATMQSKKNHVVEMFKILAQSGKLIKISELDMGYVDAAGNSVATENLTDEQAKQMAEFYKFIIEQYFENIPAAQRYGITQWALTDSPKGSGWRGGEPIGLWTEKWDRKRTFAGFADGLIGK